VISWDRRTEDRRESRQSPPVERRSGDRRKTPPFTWDAADFVVVPAQETEATAAPPVTRLDSTATSTAGDRNQQRRPTNVDSYGHASVDDTFHKRSE
jgi:hypothetical protein